VKATVDAKALAAAVGRVVLFLPRSTHMPVLGCVHVEADGETLTLTASNLDHTARTTVPAEVAEGGVALAPGAVLGRVAGAPSGPVSLVLDGSQLLVDAESLTFSMPSPPANEYPRIVFPEGEPVSLAEWWPIVQRVAKAASTEEAKPSLCTVQFSEGQIAAVDGYRLHWADGPQGVDVAVPSAALARAFKVLGDGVSMAASDREVLFSDGTTTIVARLYADDVPNWRGLAAAGAPHAIEVDAAELADVVAALGAIPDASEALLLTVEDGRMTVDRRVTDVGAGVATVAVDGSWPDAMGINGRYLTEALAAVGLERATIAVTSRQKPLVFHGPEVSALVMAVDIRRARS
jgi:DNA polymerase-3 subunit beta